MLNRNQLKKLRSAAFPACDISGLIDIRKVKIADAQSKANKVINYIDRVGNPYIFRVGDIAVKIEFEDSRDFSEAFVNSLCAS